MLPFLQEAIIPKTANTDSNAIFLAVKNFIKRKLIYTKDITYYANKSRGNNIIMFTPKEASLSLPLWG
ncbi:hypothetical protein BEL04_23180 [Mucilaginibacter sp. PPCGB 2223]|nr:hypothetical protein BEL04_23180 [Mucilaginibacter sp. PPCGB 2223]